MRLQDRGDGGLQADGLPGRHREGRDPVKWLYRLLRLMNDANAVSKGKVGRRVGRRAYGKVTGRASRRWLK